MRLGHRRSQQQQEPIRDYWLIAICRCGDDNDGGICVLEVNRVCYVIRVCRLGWYDVVGCTQAAGGIATLAGRHAGGTVSS